MREQRDRAMMLGLAGIRVKQLMQFRRHRHRVQQQDKPGQQRGGDRLAGQLEMTAYKLQIVCNIANTGANASLTVAAVV